MPTVKGVRSDAIKYVERNLDLYLEEVVRLAELPAPTFQEARRADYVLRRFQELGLEASLDGIGNVVGGPAGGDRRPAVLVAAHLDTVFPLDTDCRVRREDGRLHGPGVGDNASNLAGLLFLAQGLPAGDLQLERELLLAATVGEEGLGDLRGVKQVLVDRQGEFDRAIILDGSLGALVYQGVGSRRLKVSCHAPGGHSWGLFGAPSAVHVLGRIISRISYLAVPQQPRTTYNVGTVRGGTSVNTIASEAELLLDLRSVDRAELVKLEERVVALLKEAATEAGVEVRWECIGDRPTGSVPADHPLVRAVRRVHRRLGIPTVEVPSSTDGNALLSQGIPAVTIGLTTGGNGHRTDEYINIAPASLGLQQLLWLLAELE